jgi:hypothetical protein
MPTEETTLRLLVSMVLAAVSVLVTKLEEPRTGMVAVLAKTCVRVVVPWTARFPSVESPPPTCKSPVVETDPTRFVVPRTCREVPTVTLDSEEIAMPTVITLEKRAFEAMTVADVVEPTTAALHDTNRLQPVLIDPRAARLL